MAVTRAKATTLLNATEMGLFDDSRANALRGHTEAQLARLVIRARTARDRSRDLEKRQRLSSRKSTGSKSGKSGQANARTGEKAELLADILTRLQDQHRETAKAAKAAARAKPVAKKAAAKKSTAKKSTAKKAASKKSAADKAKVSKTARKAVVKQASSAGKSSTAKAVKKTTATKSATKRASKSNTVAKKAGAKTAAAKKTAAKTATAKPSAASSAKAKKTAVRKSAAKSASRGAADGAAKTKSKRTISPERALKNTRKLLEQHNAEASQPKPWDTLGHEGTAQATPGFQSPQARSKALALHAGETRQAPINGSISTRDRKNQGKRDHRNKPD